MTSTRTRKTTPADDGATAHPVRMSLGRALELALTRKAGASSTVTLSRNSKGETQVEVVVATGEADGQPKTPLAAATVARDLYDTLCREYPRLDAATPTEPTE